MRHSGADGQERCDGERAKRLAEEFFAAVLNGGDPAAAERIVAAEFVAHHPAFPRGIRGRQGLAAMGAGFRAGFPDLRYAIEDRFGEGDRVCVRWTATGTHTGPFQGMPPTGRAVRITGTDVFREADGQLAEAWVISDFLGLLQQIGAIPPSPPSG